MGITNPRFHAFGFLKSERALKWCFLLKAFISKTADQPENAI
jgi:hypothetical protein